MDLGLTGRVALVTASSKGLGRATAQALSQEGAKVVMCARNQEVDADTLQANLLTSIRLVQAALPPMRAAGWGRICLITSRAVKEPIPTLALSNTARTGLWAWARTAPADLFPEGITLNLACPGSHDTERARQAGQLGGGPVGDPADFAKGLL